MNCTEVRDLAEVDAVGGLPAEVAREVASHVAGCASCRLAVRQARQVAGLLRLGVPEVEVPPSLGAQLIDSARRAAREPARAQAPSRAGSVAGAPSRSPNRLAGQPGRNRQARPAEWQRRLAAHPNGPRPWRALAGLAAATLLLVAVNGWLALQLATLRGEVRHAEERLAESWQTTQTASEVLAKVAASGGAMARLEGTESAPGALGTLYYSPGGYEAVFMVQGLPPPSPGEVYQLWLLTAQQRTNGGTFYPEDGGRRLLIVRSPVPFTTFDAIGITNEPRGGSPEPRGQRHMFGQLQRA